MEMRANGYIPYPDPVQCLDLTCSRQICTHKALYSHRAASLYVAIRRSPTAFRTFTSTHPSV